MTSRKESIQALLKKAEAQLRDVETEYNRSLHAKAIEAELRIDIKNLCENMRSALDYLAHDIRERFCPSATPGDRFYFPVMPEKKASKAALISGFLVFAKSLQPSSQL